MQANLAGQRLGDFELTRELGRGGMGVVYEAVQISLGRRVALKVLSPGLGLTPKVIDRFHREAAAAARLHHTNIVPVYSTGEERGTHFYAMELIDGPSLDAVIRGLRPAPGTGPNDQTRVAPPESQLSTDSSELGPAAVTPPPTAVRSVRFSARRIDRAAAMIAEVADALHHAHQHGVTHRDIKPSNLLLSSDGRLSITDFGLARLLEQPSMTVSGEFLGTPAYMSPEQIATGRTPVDHRTDIYSLGATLYELLVLQPPFDADGRDRLLAMVIQKDPVPLHRIDPNIPRDLETICLKCLEKDPDRRYASAKDLADDLRRFLNRFAIHAKRAGPFARAKKWVKRNPALAGVIGCLFLALLAAGFFAYQGKLDRDRLLVGERQAAVERAVFEAMGGETRAALEAIADAEAKGAEPGRLNMLRGVVEINRGRYQEALVHLEQAERQMPDSVAVKGLLTTAYMSSMQYEKCEETCLRAEQLQPKTPEDYIFLGQAQAPMDPRRALQTMDQAPPRHRRSMIARLARAGVQLRYTEETGQTADAEQLLRDVDGIASEDLPIVLNFRMRALLAAAGTVPHESTAWKGYMSRAADVEVRLTRYPFAMSAIYGRAHYYHVAGDDDKLLDAVHQTKEFTGSGTSLDFEFDVLYRRRRFDEALESVRSNLPPGNPFRSQREAVLLATMGRLEQAKRAVGDHLRSGGANLALAPAYINLLPPEERADLATLTREILDHKLDAVPNWRNGWYRRVLQYHAGRLSAGELLHQAGPSYTNLCEAHFCIGLEALGRGKRAEAKEQFAMCCATNVYTYTEYTCGADRVPDLHRRTAHLVPPWAK